MAELKTKYLGFELKNPIIAASCGITNSIDQIKKLEDNGIAAVVLKSLFEEQILYFAHKHIDENQLDYPEAYDYIKNYVKADELEKYLSLIKNLKKSVSIPIIASINCISSDEWISFTKEIENAGADAIELNIMTLSANPKISSYDVENKLFEIIDKVHSTTKLPLAVKLSPHYTALANILVRLDWKKQIKGAVLFNRQYSPDIDIENMKITSTNILSDPHDYSESLRWIALTSDTVKIDLAATTGIWDGKTIIKQLLAGAKAVQIASALYKNGPQIIGNMLKEIEEWLNNKGLSSVNEIIGKMSFKNLDSPVAYERIQFMKYFSKIE